MLKKIKNSLTARIFIVTCLLLIFTSSITYIFISVMTPVTYSSKLDRTLEQKVHHLIEKLEQTTLEDSSTIFDRFLMDSGATIFLRYPDGSITLPPSNLVIDSSSDPNIAIGKENEETIYIGDGKIIPNTPHDITAAKEYSFSFSQSDTQYTLLVSGTMGTVNQVTSVLLQILPWLICTIVLISAIAAFFYSRYITKPIVSISNISKKMSLMELECRCEENRKDEIGVLANSLNEMSQKLSAALSELQSANLSLQKDIDRERELDKQRMILFSAVSHELKTPITVLQGQLDGMLQNLGSYKDRDKYLARSLSVTKAMESMVQEIVTISRIDSPDFTLHIKKFDLSEVIREIITKYIEIIEQKKMKLEINIADELIIDADKKLIEKAVSNLINNAISYSPDGEKLIIHLYSRDKKIQFSICNTGSHISEKALPYLFDAFYRADDSRSRQTGGSGLGLYLVSRILKLHNGTYQIRNTTSGVEVSFSL